MSLGRPAPSPRAMGRLSLARLEHCPISARPRVDPDGLGVGIVHFGPGAFHRGHQAVFTEAALCVEPGQWGICGVTQRSAKVVEALRPQDGLFSVLERAGDATSIRVNAVEREVLDATADWAAVRARLASAATRVVTITVSEKGYRHDPATGRLRRDDDGIRHDAACPVPATAVGRLVRGLQARRAACSAPVTILCCDNLPANGRLLEILLADFCALLDPREGAPLAEWIAEHVRFPCTVVDRMVPATSSRDLSEAASLLGLTDRAAVVTEGYASWVIADDFAGERPAWERAGAMLVADVKPWEDAKLRLLNGCHTAIAYLGQLAGFELVADAMGDERIAGFARALMADDACATLARVPGLDLERYVESVLRRLSNATLRYRLDQVAADGSQKLGPRLLGTIADRLRDGAEPRWASLGLAGWMRYVAHAASDDGARSLRIDDPLASSIARALAGATGAAQVVDRLLGIDAIFAGELSESAPLRELLVEQLESLMRIGAMRTLAAQL